MENKAVSVKSENCSGCLCCQLICSFTYHGVFSPNLAYIKIGWDSVEHKIEFSEDCKECGICAKYCSYGALELKKKV